MTTKITVIKNEEGTTGISAPNDVFISFPSIFEDLSPEEQNHIEDLAEIAGLTTPQYFEALLEDIIESDSFRKRVESVKF